jgi:hypothetical protein
MVDLHIKESSLACPFFMPTQKSEEAAWLHPSRLPLGAGWSGRCCAAGHEGTVPSDQSLKEHCNLGYAVTCPHLPKERTADAVRFSIARDRTSQLEIWFVCELGHRPAGHGKLKYDVARDRWLSVHPNPCTQKMAQCYLESYLRRRTSSPKPRSRMTA